MHNKIVGDLERIKKLVIRRFDTGETLSTTGRESWCLGQLISYGKIGVTPIERPAPRWSDYVFRLRKRGLPVQTIDEKHGGTYRGVHARYVLPLECEILEQEFAA